MTLSDQHRQLLLDSAITDEIITLTSIDSDGEHILFPWRNTDGSVTVQRKHYVPGEKTGYVWEAGKPLHPWVLRELDDDGPLLIVEGTKQSLAAASWAPAGYSVYGMAGCWGLSQADLSFAEDRDVFILLDADAATNLDVYEAGSRLKIRLEDEDATARFVRLPVEGKDGLDDYLAGVRPEKRTNRIERNISRATAKPADRKPAPRTDKAARTEVVRPEDDGRAQVAVNGDLKVVVDNIVGALKTRWDGHYLFNYGRALTCLEGPATLPLEDGDFLRLLADTVQMVIHKPATQRAPEQFLPGGRPDTQTVKAVMASFKDFTELKAVVRAPFARPDGTICTAAGYDESTSIVLIDSGIGDVDVPEVPTEEQRSAALDFLMNEWLGDIPFPSEGARANALALIVTPFVRSHFELAPLAVVNGLQMGVGKNLFADVVAMVTTGEFAVPMPYTIDDDETRKQITSAFRAGTELFAFDEAHVIQGASLARALTSITYTDRLLGSSRMAEFPNTVTWMSMGNNVQVNGDCSRRVYWIDLKPEGANPQDRDASSFRHPDLKGWTRDNRAALVSAVLTLVRAWFAAGKPSSPRGSTLGSFEGWDKTVGGIVGHAGLSGFLGEIKERRSETDFDGAYWLAHIQWLRETFGADTFTTSDVRREAVSALGGYEAPPKMEDPSDKAYTRQLGKAYAAKADRWYGDLRLRKAGMGHRSTLKWVIEKHSDGGMEVTGGLPAPLRVGSEFNFSRDVNVCENTRIENGAEISPSQPSTPSKEGADVKETGHTRTSAVAFDLETCSVDEIFKRSDFVRIGALMGPTGPTHVGHRMDILLRHLNQAETITGHNIINFDIKALARHHGADYEALCAKSVDTMIVDRQLNPPISKGKGGVSLNDLAERLGVPMKTDDIKRLARKHGGFDSIPLDDDEYTSYLEGDVTASQAVYEALKDAAESDPYISREHRVQTIMGRMTLNGFRVDVPLVTERYRAGQDKLNAIKERLHGTYGFPTGGAAPQRSKAGKEAFHAALRGSGIGESWLAQNWPKNQDGTLSLAKEVLTEKRELFEGPKPDAAALCDAILEMNGVRSIYGNCIDWLTTEGRVHPQISPEQASGRWSVTDPGLTVVGKKGEKVHERAIYLPEEGHVLVAFDADQVDMRMVAAASQDRAYMDLFIPKPGQKVDPHTDIANMVGLKREEAKPIGHGWNYNMSINGQVRNGVARELAEKFDRGMRDSFPRLVNWKQEMVDIGSAGGTFDNGFGRKMRCHPESAWTQSSALMGQGGTRDALAEGLLRLPKEILPMLRVVVHDEIVLSIPRDIVEDVCRTVVDCMTFEHRGVPITWGTSKFGTSWADCYRKD